MGARLSLRIRSDTLYHASATEDTLKIRDTIETKASYVLYCSTVVVRRSFQLEELVKLKL